MSLIIGIDPGKSGGFAILNKEGQVVLAQKMPDTYQELLSLITPHKGVIAGGIIEQLTVFMWRGVTNNGELMRNFGAWEMLLAALCIPSIQVPARTWQKELGLTSVSAKPISSMTDKEQTAWYKSKKIKNKVYAARLFTNVRVTNYIADALLIAEYGRRKGRF